jgi:hypothetical protein
MEGLQARRAKLGDDMKRIFESRGLAHALGAVGVVAIPFLIRRCRCCRCRWICLCPCALLLVRVDVVVIVDAVVIVRL